MQNVTYILCNEAKVSHYAKSCDANESTGGSRDFLRNIVSTSEDFWANGLKLRN